jgi:hypothetical protein
MAIWYILWPFFLPVLAFCTKTYLATLKLLSMLHKNKLTQAEWCVPSNVVVIVSTLRTKRFLVSAPVALSSGIVTTRH